MELFTDILEAEGFEVAQAKNAEDNISILPCPGYAV